MLIDSPYVAKRVQAGIPIWDITAYGRDIGVLTDLPMEDSPMATVRYGMYDEDEVTFTADTIHSVLEKVGDYLASIDYALHAEYEAEYYAEVIGPMRAAEDRAEALGWGQADEDPIW